MLQHIKKYVWFAAFFILACSGSSDTSSDGSSTDSDDTASLTACNDTCDHLYNDCGLVMVDDTDTDLSESECVDSCDLEQSTVVDCLSEADCSDVDTVNECFLLGATETDTTECDSDSDCDSSNNEECVSGTCVGQECNSDSDCSNCERCSSGSCYDCGEGPYGCYC